jgi:hypothetical protein
MAGKKRKRSTDEGYNSYRLTMAEAGRIAEGIASHLGGSTRGEPIALAFLVLLKSFTYMLDADQREYNLTAIEKEFYPYMPAAVDALQRSTAAEYRRLIREGSES